MNTVKILSGFLACAVISSVCCSSVLAQGNVKADIGDNGVVTYTFSGITEDDTGIVTSQDGVVEVHLESEGIHGYTNNDGMHLGASSNQYTNKNNNPEELGDYIILRAPENGKVEFSGVRIAYWKNGLYDGNKNYYIGPSYSTISGIELEKNEYIAIGFRNVDASNYVRSVTFTPDKYSEAYKFNIAADKIAEKELVVEYTDSGDNFTAAKNLSDLIKTQFAGTGEVLLTGLKFNDIPNTVNIESVTIR